MSQGGDYWHFGCSHPLEKTIQQDGGDFKRFSSKKCAQTYTGSVYRQLRSGDRQVVDREPTKSKDVLVCTVNR